MGCDVCGRFSTRFTVVFQSTHPSGVRLAAPSGGIQPSVISIHASQWGATTITRCSNTRREYFNPRTPVGCDKIEPAKPSATTHFNPRTPVGCDCTTRPPTKRRPDFNPRTPVGCDDSRMSPITGVDYFNPRTPVGCDHMRDLCQSTLILFQSTHPSGVRLYNSRRSV